MPIFPSCSRRSFVQLGGGIETLNLAAWFERLKGHSSCREPLNRAERPRQPEAIAFDVIQFGNTFKIEGSGIRIDFEVEGMEMPRGADAGFAVWALLPRAMEGGFDLKIRHPVDPVLARNAERLSSIWEMWVPGRYRSVKVSGEGEWSGKRPGRLPRVDLYSGGVDSTFSILQLADANKRGYALTVDGLDYRDHWAERFPGLIAKTDPLLEKLNYQRVIVRTNANYDPINLTHGFTLASCVFLLGDVFEKGTIAADRTPAQDMVTFPWGTNHVTTSYFAGSDFEMETIFEVSRVEKLAAIAALEVGLPFLSFCRKHKVMPANCGRCGKCIRTKAMFAVAAGNVPEIFVDNAFHEDLMKRIELDGRERAHGLDLYCYAKEHGRIDAVPGLISLVRQCRHIDSSSYQED